MKSLKFLLGAAFAVGFAASANAQTINITGATAFRQAAHQAIIASLTNVTFGYTGTNINNASRAIFKGNLGVTPVIVRTSWSGSVAGVGAIVNSTSVSYIPASTVVISDPGTPNIGTTDSTTVNRIAFADNTQDNTPFTSVALAGGPVGAIVFVPVTNEGSPLTQGDNVTDLQLRSLITAGLAPLKFLTGDVADEGKFAVWTGRNTLSGTRAIYLTTNGLPASSAAVQQYRPTPWNTNTNINALQLWPTTDPNVANNTVNVWGPAVDGGGGFDSGGSASRAFQATFNTTVSFFASAANVSDPLATPDFTLPGENLALITNISVQDAQDVQDGGGKVLAFNGVYIEPEALPLGLSPASRNLVINGQYTFWSNENLFNRTNVTTTEQDLVNALFVNVPLQIGGNGIPLTDMLVSRTEDGGTLTIGNIP